MSGPADAGVHRAAGPRLVASCRAVPEAAPGVRCPTGHARITPAFDLPARHVIHTVGPVYASEAASRPLLASAIRSALALANNPAHGIRRVALPAVSCGAFGYPPERAAQCALEVCVTEHGDLGQIHFVMSGHDTFRPFAACADGLFPLLRAD